MHKTAAIPDDTIMRGGWEACHAAPSLPAVVGLPADPHSVDEQAHWYQLQPVDGSGGRKYERRRSDRHFLPRKSRVKRPDVLPMETDQGGMIYQAKVQYNLVYIP